MASPTEVVPFTFFQQLKGITGYRKNETYNIKGLIELIRTMEDFYPTEVDEKYDGFRIQIHRVGNKVQIWSEDGGDVTAKFPTIVQQAKDFCARSYVIDGEIVGWDGDGYRVGKHIGRSDVSGYAHTKEQSDDSHYYANIFDIVYFADRSIAGLPLHQRKFILTHEFKNLRNLFCIDFKVAKNEEELIQAVEYFKRRAGSEGAMVKKLSSNYQLDGQTNDWIKFKNEIDIDAEVLAAFKVKDSEGYNYIMAIRDTGNRLVPIGKTYNVTPEAISMKGPAKAGDILRVAFVNLNKYTDLKTNQVWYNWWSPRVIEYREDRTKPDNITTAEKIVKYTKGEVENKPFPDRYKEIVKEFQSGKYEMIECFEPQAYWEDGFQDIFLENPPSDRKLRFVLQAHIRGRSVHLDSRRQVDNNNGVGMTLHVPASLSRQPENYEDAKSLFDKEVMPLITQMLNNPMKKFQSNKKALVPNEWLDVSGKISIGNPGSTANLPAYMIVLDSGEVEFGALKGDYHEYWFYGKLMNGKYIDRLIEDTNQRKEVNGTKYSWMFFKSDAIPYVLTKRAIEVGFIPPYLVSALPKIVEQKVPEQFHYWKSKNRSERMAKREELITHMKKTNLKFESWTPSKPEPVVEKFESVVCVKAESMTFDKAVDMGNDGLPKFLEVSGILFYPGVHRSSSGVARGYSSQSLKTAKLMAGKNMNLAYINWYHMKDEPYRAGILTDIWWDQNTKVEHAGEQGCLKYRGFIFHRDAIAEVWNSRTKNVSAELSFNTLGKYEGVPSASDICVTGMAMTSSPALPNADIGEICTIDNEGKRSCSRVE